MSEEIIILNNVSKKYSSVGRKNNFFALDNINLAICEGEQVAFLGKNGAGKTHLLKVISGIIHPSCGDVIVRRRALPIYEYGTILNTELTGRENIYLFGALCGVNKQIINENFSNIANFSEIGDFLDTRLRYYSTGMRFRLIFSTAVFLNPEIFILDDALAVGDSDFLVKAQTKILELESCKTTVLVASHSNELLKRFCKRGIVMEKGKIVFSSGIHEALEHYSQHQLSKKVF